MPSFPWRFRRRHIDPHPSGILKRRIFGRLSLWTAILLAFLLCLPLLLKALGFLLTTGPVEAWLKARARGALASSLHSRVEFRDLTTDLLTHLEARDVTLYALDPPGSEPYVRFDLLRLDYPFLPILTGRWIIRHIHLGKVHILLHRDPQGRWHIPVLGSPSPAGRKGPAVTTQGFRVLFRRFTVDRVEVEVRDDLQGHHALLDCRNGKLRRSQTSWTLEAQVASLKANGQTLIDPASRADNTLRARWSPLETRLERSNLSFLGGTLSATGVLVRDGTLKDASLEIHQADLSRVGRALRLPEAPFQGALEGTLRLSGNLERPDRLRSVGDLTLHPRAGSDEEPSPIAMRWTLDHGSLEATFEESANDILLKATVDSRGALKGLVTASLASLPTLTALLCWGGEIEGSLAATGDITGSWRRPRLDLRLDGNAIRVERFPLDRVDGRVLWDAQGVRLDRVRVVGTQRAFHTDQAPFGLKGLSGGVTYQLLVEGPLSNPTARLEAELKRPGWGPLKFDRGALQVVLENHVARLDFFKGQRDFTVLQLKARHDLRKGVGALDLVTLESKSEAQRGKDFAVALPEKAAQDGDHFLADWAKKAGGGFQAEAHCEDFDLSRLGDLSPTSRRVAGKLTAALSLKRAGRKQPLKVTGKASLREGLYQARYDAAPVKDLQGSVAWQGSRFTLAGARGSIRDIPFELEGHAALPQTESPWDLRLKASGREALLVSGRVGPGGWDLTATLDALPAALAEPFLTFFRDMRGSFSGRVAVRGQTSSPTFHGPFTTDAFSTFLPVLNARLSDAQLETTLSGSRVTLAPSPLRFNGGPVTLRGTTSWNAPGLGDFDFKGSCAKVKVDLPRLLKGTLEKGSFSWARHEDGFLLSGNLDISEGRWLKDFETGEDEPGATYGDFLDRTRFSVRFRGAQNLWLDNNMARCRVDAEATLTGSWPAPTLLGRFTALEGHVLYLDRRFVIEKGSAVFDDATVINPQLDLRAATTLRSYSATGAPQPYAIRFTVSGPLDRMALGLSSDPNLSQADIVSLLTFGATQQEMVTRNPRTGASTGETLLTRAGTLTAQTLADYSARKVGRWIGLEDLSLEGDALGLEKGSSSDGARISATTRVTDRVSVTYRTNTGSDPLRSVRIGYYLSNQLSVVTEGAQSGETSLDLKYRLLFR